MSKANHKLIPLILVLLTGFAAVDAGAQDQQQTERELAAVNAAISDIQDWLTEANARQSSQQQRLRAVELEINRVHMRMQSLTTAIADNEARLNSLQQQQDSLREQRDRQSERLAEILRAVYMAGNVPALKLFLNQQSLDSTARLFHYAQLFSQQQLSQIENYQTTLAELQRLDRDLSDSLAELNRQQSELQTQSESLDQARHEREQALAALSTAIDSRSTELEQLELNQAELESLLAEIARAMEGIRSFVDVPPFAEQRGRLPIPTEGRVSSRFGASYGGGSLTRQGIVMAASPGSPVRAVHAGRVAFADWLRGAGLLVIVNHGEGYMSLYGGNEALAVTAGDWVDSGQVVATSGPGVGPENPGLYFEIRYQGEAVNPATWLRD